MSLFIFSCKGEETFKYANHEHPGIVKISNEIANAPNDAKLIAQRGLIFFELESYPEAILDLKKALALEPNQPNIYNWLSDAYYEEGDLKMAPDVLYLLKKKYGPSNRLNLKMSELELLSDNQQGALALIQEVDSPQAPNPDLAYMKGQIFLSENDTTKSEEFFKQAILLSDSVIVDAFYELGNIQIARKQEPSHLETAIKLDSNNIQFLFTKAEFLSENNKLDPALAIYKKIIRLDTRNVDALFNVGLISLEKDLNKEALKNFEIVTQIDPSYFKAFYFQGIANEKLANYDKAKACYTHLLKMDPTFNEAKEALSALDTLSH